MNQRHVHLGDVEVLILDEADRMLDMGFIDDVRRIISVIPRERQTLFFSATMSPEVSSLANTMLASPVRVEITPQATTVERIEQKVLFVNKNDKELLLLKLLEGEHLDRVLVFTRTKHGANKVEKILNKKGIRADALHGNKSQTARTVALRNFKNGKTRVLVATDIAARGIDVDGISHVINYELPNESESYVHRIGRTARAGTDGTAYSFCCAEERTFLRDIERLTRQPITIMEHEFHDENARLASGAAARLPPRGAFQRGRAGGNAFGRFSDRREGARAPRDRDGPRPAYRDTARPRSAGNRDGPRPRGPSSGGRTGGGAGPRRSAPRSGPRR
jgi:ATP-dependent RNA helicase RhlE